MGILDHIALFVILNVPLILLLLALLFGVLTVSRHIEKATPDKHFVYDTFIGYILLLPIGITSIWMFITNTWLAHEILGLYGWHAMPFQFEYAVANLAIGVTCFIAFRESFDFRVAAIIVSGIYLWGCAAGHIKQLLISPYFVLEQIGSLLFMELIVPFILFSLVFARLLDHKKHLKAQHHHP